MVKGGNLVAFECAVLLMLYDLECALLLVVRGGNLVAFKRVVLVVVVRDGAPSLHGFIFLVESSFYCSLRNSLDNITLFFVL